MTRGEFFSWCTLISVGALTWLAFGFGGLACLIVGLIVGNIDISWIDAQDFTDAQPSPAVADIPVPVRRFGASDVRVPVVDVSTAPASPFKVRRAKVVKRKLPANVVVLKPRKVS